MQIHEPSRGLKVTFPLRNNGNNVVALLPREEAPNRAMKYSHNFNLEPFSVARVTDSFYLQNP